MSEDGEKDQEKDPEGPSRPDTAAARRARRASARKGAGADAGDDAKRSAPKGKSSAAGRANRADKAGASASSASAGKERPTPKRDRQDTKQPSLFRRLSRFLREVWAELRKVIWPNRKQMVTYTTAVLIFVIFMVGLVFLLDLGFNEVVALVFGD